MKKKRLTSLLLAAALSAGTLAGCGSASKPADTTAAAAKETTAAAKEAAPAATTAAAEASQEKIELTFYYPIGVGGALATLIENLATEFTKENPNIIMHPVFTGDSTETITKVVSALQAGSPPDFAILPNSQLYSMVDMDAVLPLDDLIAKDGGQEYIDDFLPAFMTNSVYDGSVYAIPFQRSSLILYYNKDHFREAGLDPEKAPTNWDEFAEYAKQLTVFDAAGNAERWGVMIPMGDTFIYPAFCRQNGEGNSELMSKDGKAVYYDTQENVEALQYLIDLSAVHNATPAGKIKWADGPANFIAGATSMTITTSGNLTNVLNSAEFEVGTALLPAGKQNGSCTGGANFYIFKDVDPAHQEAAWKFIRWITDPERAAQWSIDTGYVATRYSAYETDRMKEYQANVPQAAVAKEQLEYASSEICVYEAKRCDQALAQALDAAMIGEMTAADALKQAQAEADKILKDYQ